LEIPAWLLVRGINKPLIAVEENTMKRTACLFLVVSVVGVHLAQGDSISKTRKVREMLAALRMEETTNRLEHAQEMQIQTMSKQQLAGITLDADQQKAYDEFQQNLVDLIRASMSWKALEPDFVKMYSDAYNEEEIDGILAFYHTSAGRAMLAKTPELTERSITISQQRMAAISPKIQALIDKFMRDNL
jgi:uncharacterized protein